MCVRSEERGVCLRAGHTVIAVRCFRDSLKVVRMYHAIPLYFVILEIIHFLREECNIKGGGLKKGGNLPLFPPLAKTLAVQVG